jgi:hypothetical protein
MNLNIHAGATPIKSRYHIATFEDRDDWLRLLLAADELSPGAKVVGARIALHHNIKSGQCNPAIGTLVLGTRMSESTVRRMIRDELEVKGWLRVDRTLGRHSNSFKLIAPTLSDATGFNPVNSDTVEDSNPITDDRVQDGPTLSTLTPQPCQNQPNPVTADTQNRESITENRTAKEIDSPRLDLADEDSGRRSRSPSSETEADFEIWYKQYPKQVDKADARKAYLTVIKKKLATPEQLLAAAMRYAAERTGQDPKYTKNPATWLNKHSWLNEPASIGDTYSAAQQGQSNHIAVAEQIARQLMEKDGGYVQ